MSAAVIAFLQVLYAATHSYCTVGVAHVSLGAPVPFLSLVYGGNCWDAVQYAGSIGGIVFGPFGF